jgi:hypothetical protein
MSCPHTRAVKLGQTPTHGPHGRRSMEALAAACVFAAGARKEAVPRARGGGGARAAWGECFGGCAARVARAGKRDNVCVRGGAAGSHRLRWHAALCLPEGLKRGAPRRLPRSDSRGAAPGPPAAPAPARFAVRPSEGLTAVPRAPAHRARGGVGGLPRGPRRGAMTALCVCGAAQRLGAHKRKAWQRGGRGGVAGSTSYPGFGASRCRGVEGEAAQGGALKKRVATAAACGCAAGGREAQEAMAVAPRVGQPQWAAHSRDAQRAPSCASGLGRWPPPLAGAATPFWAPMALRRPRGWEGAGANRAVAAVGCGEPVSRRKAGMSGSRGGGRRASSLKRGGRGRRGSPHTTLAPSHITVVGRRARTRGLSNTVQSGGGAPAKWCKGDGRTPRGHGHG